MQEVSSETLQKMIVSLRQQINNYVSTVTEMDVKIMTLREELNEAQAELAEYREKEIEEMDGQSDAK